MSKPIETINHLVHEEVRKLLFSQIPEVQERATEYICEQIAASDRPNKIFMNQIHLLVNEFLHKLYGDDIDKARRESEWVKLGVEVTLKGRI